MSDVTLTDAERMDLLCGEPDCVECRETEAACLRILAALSQEREQVRAERDREWRAAVEALAAQLERPLDGMRQRASTNADFAEIAAMEHTKRSSAQSVRRLAQDGPRPAQEGERACPQHPATSPSACERCAWGWSCQNPAPIPSADSCHCDRTVSALVECPVHGNHPEAGPR